MCAPDPSKTTEEECVPKWVNGRCSDLSKTTEEECVPKWVNGRCSDLSKTTEEECVPKWVNGRCSDLSKTTEEECVPKWVNGRCSDLSKTTEEECIPKWTEEHFTKEECIMQGLLQRKKYLTTDDLRKVNNAAVVFGWKDNSCSYMWNVKRDDWRVQKGSQTQTRRGGEGVFATQAEQPVRFCEHGRKHVNSLSKY